MPHNHSQRDFNHELQAALDRHQQGDLAGARDRYANLLEDLPEHPEILHLLGVVHHQLGEHVRAEQLVRRAIAAIGTEAIYHNNLGEILLAQGRTDESLACFHQAVALSPDVADFAAGVAQAETLLAGSFQVSAPAMAVKYQCGCEAHGSTADCLDALETLRAPSALAPGELEAAVPCLYERIKHRIIRLRVRSHDDWPWLEQEITGHQARILADFNTRWLVSICDTFADHGTPVERRNAMLVSLLVNWEKLARTERMLVDGDPATIDVTRQQAMQVNHPLWDGMVTMALSEGANVVPNIFERLGTLMAETPLLEAIFLAIYHRMRAEPLSTLAVLDRAHARDLFADIDGVFPAPGAGQDPAQSRQKGIPDGEIAILHGRDRWKDSASFQDMWLERARRLTAFIDGGETAIELGAGNLSGKSFIEAQGLRYFNSDWTARDKTTLVLDLNRRPLPDPTTFGSYDWVVFSGVLEYLGDLDGLLKWCSLIGRNVLASYMPVDTANITSVEQHIPELIKRSGNGVANHYTIADFLDIANRYFIVNKIDRWNQHLLIGGRSISRYAH